LLVGWLVGSLGALCCCRWSQGPRQFGLPGCAGLGRRAGELRLELLPHLTAPPWLVLLSPFSAMADGC